MTKNDKAFIKFVKQECKTHGIKCDLRDVSYIKLSGKMKVSGYFDEDGAVLACSMNNQDALGVLVHEYGHMTQWLDEEPTFVIVNDSLIALDDWLQGVEVKNMDKHIAICRDMELNNEKRSVELIKKHRLSIDIPTYIRKANAYVHFYNYMLISRKWSTPGNTPYSNQNVLDTMSPLFNMKYSAMSQRVKKVFIQENI